MNALVDWVTVSFKSLKNFNCFFKYFNLNFDDFKPISGRWNYTNGLWQDGITVYYNVREDGMKYLYDMCLNFSGGGCRRYETLRGELFNWVDWFTFLLKSFGKDCIHISRTDLALDVMDDTVPDMIKIIKDVDKRKYISLFRRVVTGRGAEEWAYFGAPTSDVRLRIYNKALERGLDLKWIRFEYQFRNQGAMKYINHLVTCKNLGQAFSDYIDKSVVFTTKPNIDIQNNQKRLVPQNWWLNFTAGAKEITKYKIVGVEYNYTALQRYLGNQVAPSLLAYLKANGGDVEPLMELIQGAALRLNQKQKTVIEDRLLEKQNQLNKLRLELFGA